VTIVGFVLLMALLTALWLRWVIRGPLADILPSTKRGVGWYDATTGEWRFQRLDGSDAIRAAIGVDTFFKQLRIWTLEQAVRR